MPFMRISVYFSIFIIQMLGMSFQKLVNCINVTPRYRDGTELAGATNNELSLTSLVSDDQGLYQCSAKLTADPSLPAVRSRDAMLTIRGIVYHK